MDLVLFLRAGYLAAAASLLLISFIPALSNRFLAYGARSASSSTPSAQRKKAAKEHPDKAPYSILFDRIADLTVPHSWFASFYAVSTVCLLFWASQLVTEGPAFRAMAALTSQRSTSMTFRQVLVTWLMMMVQSSRRLYECLEFSRPSTSQMWFGHWVLGMGFYTATSLAIWVEGIPAITNHTFTANDFAITGPNVRTFVSVLLFILASGFQHDCHAYLASLKGKPVSSDEREQKREANGYKLPEHPAFSGLIAPHYTAECLIYTSLAIVATPQGAWLNWTVTCALVFAAVNLGITADGTKKWYESRFGREAIEGKWRMIPDVY